MEAGPCLTWEKLAVPADTAHTRRFLAFPTLCRCWHSPVPRQCSSSGMGELSVMVAQGLSTSLYQHTLCQWLPGGNSKCRTDAHLSSCHLAIFSTFSQCLLPSHSHQYEEKTSPQLLPSGFTFLHLSPAHDVSVCKFQLKKKKNRVFCVFHLHISCL